MNPNEHDKAATRNCLTAEVDAPARQDSAVSPELLALLRDRVATRFYDDSRVIDTVARAILR